MVLIVLAVIFLICMVLYKPGLKFFLLWIFACAIVGYFVNSAGRSGAMYLAFWGLVIYLFIWSHDGYSEKSSNDGSYRGNSGDTAERNLYDKVYENGSKRVENLSKTGYYYSDGKESWVGMLGEEHRSNGEVVRKNEYIPGRRDIYNEAGEYVGYEYDSLGVTYRVDK